MRVAFHTLGCKVNQYETEALIEEFERLGAEIVKENEPADVYIVNTCTVTNIADRKSRQYIRRMKALNPEALMVVTGCYAQVASEDVEAIDGVDIIIGNSLKSEIPKLVWKRVAGDIPSPLKKVLPYEGLNFYDDMGFVTSSELGATRAYIKIQEGCNRFCSYCLIPFARGRVRSRALPEILEEAEMLLAKGFKEIVLTGINTALYGTEPGFDYERLPDEAGMSGLEAVVKRLDALPGDFRIRLSSLEPTVVDLDNIERITKYGKLCHHLHLSVQAGSDHVLEAMNRHYSRADYLRIVRALRQRDPLYGITTDIIVGFPGETEVDFEDTLRIVEEAEFGRVHGFRYSLRKGTKAAAQGDTVPGQVKADRAARLEAKATEVATLFNEANLSQKQRLLCEEISGDREAGLYVTGYTDNYIKTYVDVDDLREKGIDPEALVGNFVWVELTGVREDGCTAEVVNEARCEV